MSDRYSLCVIFDGSIQVLATEPDGSARGSPLFYSIEHARLWIERDKARGMVERDVPTFAATSGAAPALATAI